MKRLFATALLLVGLTAAPAEAATVTTFSGSCVLRGDDVFTPALTMQAQAASAFADVSGTCRGNVTPAGGTPRKLAGVPARLVLATTGSGLSCAGGALGGTADLHVGGVTISMKVTEPQVTAVSVLLMSGTTTGQASGVAYADERTDLLGTVQACTGAGVASVPITLTFSTLAPVG